LDTNLYSSDASDGAYKKSESIQRSSTRLTSHRNLVSGSSLLGGGTSTYGIETCGQFGTKVSSGGQFGGTFTYTNGTYQRLFQFDTSGVVGAVTAAKFKMRAAYKTVGGSHADISIILLKAAANTATISSLGNFNSFLGHTSGWSSGDTTPYSGEYVVDGYEEALYGQNMNYYPDEYVPLNATALTDFVNNDTFQFFIIEYDEYYLDSYDSSYGASERGERSLWSGQVDSSNANYLPYIKFNYDVFGSDVTNIPSGSIDTISKTHTTSISKLTDVNR
jgi:hypothetical protein